MSRHEVRDRPDDQQEQEVGKDAGEGQLADDVEPGPLCNALHLLVFLGGLGVDLKRVVDLGC